MRFHLSQFHAGAAKKVVIGGLFSCMIACAHNYDPGMHPLDADDGLSGTPGHSKSATKSWLHTAKWVSDTSAYFACEPKCGTEDSLRLEFSAVSHAKDVKWQTSHTNYAKGHYLVKVRNPNAVMYAPWRLPAKDSAYLWMGATDDNKPPVGLYHIDANYNVQSLVDAQKIVICYKQGNGKSEVHFTEACIPVPSTAPRSANLASTDMMMMPRSAFSFSSRSGLWVSCSSGCCEVQLGY